jgi:hypothetical protein
MPGKTSLNLQERVRRFLLIALGFLGISSLAGGSGLLVDPSGQALGLPVELLEGSVFPDYLVPGLVLFFVLGVAPLVVAWGLWRRTSWSRLAVPLVGLALMIWIGVQIVVIGYAGDPPLQLAYLLLGLSILVVGTIYLKRDPLPAHRPAA